ncbi:hypothetical protein [Oceanobacillus manasiensis]|uniref:hypothetical protein n=1 Tax=Oceanobacillus manasiensis TaxID=586413 RepID=UPI0005A90BFD|nr:hypothetical protein [Oceanobacillus manasiensis]
MTYLVYPSNHWIGYHMVEHLLELGYEVHGKEIEQESNELTLFFGRNSNYSSYNLDTKYKAAYIFADYDAKLFSNTLHTYVLNENCQQVTERNHTAIHVPMLFGEWMPMNKEGMYWSGTYIRFDSSLFQKEAIYIKDFIKELVKWKNKVIADRDELYILSYRSAQTKKFKLENSVYLRDNIPIEEKLQKVLQHYKQNKLHYDNISNLNRQ